MIPVELSRIVIRDKSDQQYIYIKEIEGSRGFPIIIGSNEAAEIDRKVRGQYLERPLTHDLIRLIFEALGAQLTRIVITDLRNGTFYANLYLQQNDQEVLVDSRPSDAIALAIATSVPIFVEERVLDQVGKSDDETEFL